MNNLVRIDDALIGSRSSAGAIQAMARRQFTLSLALVIAVATFAAMAALSPPQREFADSARPASTGVQAPVFVVPLARFEVAREA